MNVPPSQQFPRPARGAAFSLVELMVVIGIIAIMVVVAAPLLTGFMEGTNITRGGQMLADQVNMARQTASSRNRPIEVRLIKLADRTESGYSAIQLWYADDTGATRELERTVLLPPAVTIASSASLSGGIVSRLTSGTMPDNAAQGAGEDFVSFLVRPNGMVAPPAEIPADLPPDEINEKLREHTQSFYFTVMSVHKAGEASLPPNFLMVQVNPLTGTPLIYRP